MLGFSGALRLRIIVAGAFIVLGFSGALRLRIIVAGASGGALAARASFSFPSMRLMLRNTLSWLSSQRILFPCSDCSGSSFGFVLAVSYCCSFTCSSSGWACCSFAWLALACSSGGDACVSLAWFLCSCVCAAVRAAAAWLHAGCQVRSFRYP